MKAARITSNILMLCVFSIFLALSVSVAEGSDPLQAEALELITKTADSICVDVVAKGQGSLLEYSGAARAELAKAIKYLVDIGVEGAAKYQESQYQGPLREDLVEAIKVSQDCKRDVFMALEKKLIVYRTNGDIEAVNQDEENPVLDPYNHEWKCGIKIENKSRVEVAAGELVFGKMLKEPNMSFARVRFSSKRTRVLAWEIKFDSAGWSLGYFGKCLEGECMGFVSKKEPHIPVFMVTEVDFDVEARRINISGVVMTKQSGGHKPYGFLSGVCEQR